MKLRITNNLEHVLRDYDWHDRRWSCRFGRAARSRSHSWNRGRRRFRALTSSPNTHPTIRPPTWEGRGGLTPEPPLASSISLNPSRSTETLGAKERGKIINNNKVSKKKEDRFPSPLLVPPLSSPMDEERGCFGEGEGGSSHVAGWLAGGMVVRNDNPNGGVR